MEPAQEPQIPREIPAPKSTPPIWTPNKPTPITSPPKVVDAAFHLHKALGPGLLESVYEITLAQELQQKRKIPIKRQHPIAIEYNGLKFDEGYRADLLVDNTLIVEIKSIEAIQPVHRMQLLSYLRLANLPLGILINFNVPLIKHGLHRLINAPQK